MRFPIYAPGINVRGTVKSHPGWTNIPIAIADVPIKSGDLVIGDEDGVVVVASERAIEVAKKAFAKSKDEDAREERLRRGETMKQVIGY